MICRCHGRDEINCFVGEFKNIGGVPGRSGFGTSDVPEARPRRFMHIDNYQSKNKRQ